MFDDGHVCTPPMTGRTRWWTCQGCGQMWRRLGDGRTRRGYRWVMTAPETAR